MHASETDFHSVAAHYSHRDLESAILDALVAAGKDPEHLKAEDLTGIDEFHVRGRAATVDLARETGIAGDMKVLDVGCGLGGASRYLAREFGCRVIGLDLSEDYCRVAAALTARLSLDARVSFKQGNALDIPYLDGSFDVVWTQHASMNIADKTALYREMWRVLRPGGRLAVYDVLAGDGGEPHYPVPWAREPSTSFLITSRQLLDTLRKVGFEIDIWRDVTEAGRCWFRNMQAKLTEKGAPPLGLQLLLGQDFRRMAQNQSLNLEQDRIALVEAVVRRPVNR